MATDLSTLAIVHSGEFHGDYERISIGRHSFWSDGNRLRPVVAGAAVADGPAAAGAGAAESQRADADGGTTGDGAAAAEGAADEDTDEVADDGDTDWKATSRRHERRAKRAEGRIVALEAKLAQATSKPTTAAGAAAGGDRPADDQAIADAVAQAQQEVRDELAGELAQTRIDAAITRAAGTRFADPADAVTALRGELEVGPDGHPDPEDVEDLVNELLRKKPYLASAAANPGAGDGGPRPLRTPDGDVTPGTGRLRKAYADSGATK